MTVSIHASATYATSDVRAGYLGDSDGSHYQGLAYAGWKGGGSYLNAMLGFGIDRYEVRRTVTLATGTQGLDTKPEGFSFGADIEAGHRFDLGALRFTPVIGLAYDNVSRSAFSENPAAAAALAFHGEARNAWQARGGARISTQATLGSAVIEPFVHATAMRELDDSRTRLNPLLAGAAVTTHSASFGKSGVQGGAGINALLSDTVGIGVSYRYTDTTNAHAHAVNGTISVRW